MRLPHALVGALCLGFALANLARPAVVPALAVAVALACGGLAATDSRFRSAALASAVVAVAWALGKRAARSARSQRARVPDRHGGVGGGRGRGAAPGRSVRPADEGARAALGDPRRARAGPAPAPTRALAAAGRAAQAPGRAAGSTRTLERLRRSEVAAPAGHPRDPARSAVPRPRSAWRHLRYRRSASDAGSAATRAGPEGRASRRDRGDRPRPCVRRRPEPARRLPRNWSLPLSRGGRAQGRRGRGRRRGSHPVSRPRNLRRSDRRAAHGGGVRARCRAPSVRGARGARRRPRVTRLARRPRA